MIRTNRTWENASFRVTFSSETEFELVNCFGDRYHCRLDENGKIVAKSAVALSYAMKARDQLGF